MKPLLLAALLAASAAGQSFSHRTHAKLQLDCGSCHAAASASTRAEDNLLPRKEACSKCHKTAEIKAPRPRRLSRFNHQLHLKVAGKAACLACHRDVTQDRPSAPLAQMAGCLVCHTQVDPPYSCEFCHGKDAQLKPASHTPDFLDTHTSKRAVPGKSSCAVCHGRKFTCLGCH